MSQHKNKESGTCSICFLDFKVHMNNSKLQKHGPRHSPCLGSDSQPIQSFNQLSTCSLRTHTDNYRIEESLQTANISNNNDIPNNIQKDKGLLTHLIKRTHLISEIPKSSRNSCTSLLHDLQKILLQPNNIAFWQKFLRFGPAILAKPNKCGKRRNLTNIILKHISDWGENQEPEDAKAVTPRPQKSPLNDDVYEKK